MNILCLLLDTSYVRQSLGFVAEIAKFTLMPREHTHTHTSLFSGPHSAGCLTEPHRILRGWQLHKGGNHKARLTAGENLADCSGLCIPSIALLFTPPHTLRHSRKRSHTRTHALHLTHSTPLHSTPLHSTPLHSTPLHSTPLRSAPLRSLSLSLSLCPTLCQFKQHPEMGGGPFRRG